MWVALATHKKSYTGAVLPNGSATCSYSSVRRDLDVKVIIIDMDACEGERASWRYALDKSHTLPNKLDASSKDQSGCNGPSRTLPSDGLNGTRRVSGSTAERTPLIKPAMTSTPHVNLLGRLNTRILTKFAVIVGYSGAKALTNAESSGWNPQAVATREVGSRHRASKPSFGHLLRSGLRDSVVQFVVVRRFQSQKGSLLCVTSKFQSSGSEDDAGRCTAKLRTKRPWTKIL